MPDKITGTNLDIFDQFLDYEVDLIQYLKNISDDYSFSNLQPVKVKLKNIFEQLKLINEYKENIIYFVDYKVQEGEKIEDVSFKFYGTVDYWWIIAIFNNIRNLYNDWCITNEQIQYLAQKYYEKEKLFTFETYYQMLFDKNEEKRNIIILKPEYINDFLFDFRKTFYEYYGVEI